MKNSNLPKIQLIGLAFIETVVFTPAIAVEVTCDDEVLYLARRS